MENYERLTTTEREAVESALDHIAQMLARVLPGDDRAARCADAMALYILQSRGAA